uniref:Uncharacterized protein n=1 Tax=Aegilops tauschii subsp. strangulata TaxID=200361 RepID=A0A453JRU8_AEGTS
QGEDGRRQPRVRPAHYHGHRAAQQGRSCGMTTGAPQFFVNNQSPCVDYYYVLVVP